MKSKAFYLQAEDKNSKSQIEDKWILSRLNTIIKETTNELENYSLDKALLKLMDFVVNDFSRTYIKMTRDREFTINVNEHGDSIMRSEIVEGGAHQDKTDWKYFQSFTNAFEMAKVEAEKFIAECKVEKSITAKKEIDDASRNSELAGGGKDEAPESV